MLSVNTIPTTIASFAASLPIININFGRFAGQVHSTDMALRSAYAKFEKSYGNRADTFFDEAFLDNDGAAIISAFAGGRIARHDAAVHLAHAWDNGLTPARSAIRKRRIVDATMAADSLLSYYEAELVAQR